MTTTLLVLTLTVFGAADTPTTKEKPKHSPYAPSLPYLTKEEEEKIDEIIENKRSMAQAIVGSGEEWLTKLSTAELLELLTLRTAAVQQ